MNSHKNTSIFILVIDNLLKTDINQFNPLSIRKTYTLHHICMWELLLIGWTVDKVRSWSRDSSSDVKLMTITVFLLDCSETFDMSSKTVECFKKQLSGGCEHAEESKNDWKEESHINVSVNGSESPQSKTTVQPASTATGNGSAGSALSQ